MLVRGTVAFGSALYNWAVSVPFMKKSGISFKIVFDKCRAGDMKYLAKNSPLSDGSPGYRGSSAAKPP